MQHNVFVIGGTGKTGRRVVKGLQARQQNVFLGGRKTEPRFDWDDPATFAPALKGMDRAYIVYYPDLAVPGAKEAIKTLAEAALQAGLEKVVLLSGKGEQEAERCEEIIAHSGLNYTIVRASWFSQNFSESFLLDPVLAGEVALPMPEAKIPFVDADDLAEVAVEALLNDAYNGQILTITGPEQLSFAEVVHLIGEGTGRTIRHQGVSVEDYAAHMRAAGLPEDYIWLFSYLFQEVLGNPDNQAISHDIEEVLGRKATSFQEYVEKTAATGVWNVSVSAI